MLIRHCVKTSPYRYVKSVCMTDNQKFCSRKCNNTIFNVTCPISAKEKNKTPSNPFSITFNPKVGSALTFKHAGQSKLAQIPTNEVARKSTNLTTA